MQTIIPQHVENENTTENNSDLPVIYEELEPLEIDPSSDYIICNLYNPTNKVRTQSIDLVLHNHRYYARKTILYRDRRFEPTELYNIHHRNIEHCLEFGVDEDNKYGYMYLEYMPNGNLANKINYFRNNNLRLSEQPLFSNVLDLIEGLYFLHSENVIHRHVKPGNILIGRYNELIYCGFGLCCDSTDECTFKNDGYLVGTGNYWSPEIIKSSTYNFESDIFSLGCVIYELYTTNVLFPGNSIDQVKNGVLYTNPTYDCVVKRIPKLEELINGMTEKNVANRWKYTRIYKCLDEWSKMSNLDIIVRNPFIIDEINKNSNEELMNNSVKSSVFSFQQPIQQPIQQTIIPLQQQPYQSLPLQQSIQPIQQQQQQQPFQQTIIPLQQQPYQSLPLQQSIQPLTMFNSYIQQQPQIFNAIPISQPPLPPPPPQQQQQPFMSITPKQAVIPSSESGNVYNTQLPIQLNKTYQPPPFQPPSQQQKSNENEIDNQVLLYPPSYQQQQQQQQPVFTLPLSNVSNKTIIPCPISSTK